MNNIINTHIEDYIFLNKEKFIVTDDCTYTMKQELDIISKMFGVSYHYVLTKIIKTKFILVYHNKDTEGIKFFYNNNYILQVAVGYKIIGWIIQPTKEGVLNNYHLTLIDIFKENIYPKFKRF